MMIATMEPDPNNPAIQAGYALTRGTALRSRLMEAVRTFGVRCFRLNPLGRRSATRADLLVLANSCNKEVLPRGVGEKTVTGLQIGTQVKEARPAPPPSDKTTFHWSGRFVDHKGFELLILAAARLKSERPEIFARIHVVMTASGPLEGRFRKMISERGMDEQFEFLGWITLDEMNAVWGRTDAFVFTSLRETTGMALQEAMMRAVTPIVIDNGGPGEMVTSECGIKVSGKDLDDLVGCLADGLARCVEQPSEVAELGKRARERALEHYSWDAVGAKMRELYKPLLASAPTSR